jgi:hypothetical protein
MTDKEIAIAIATRLIKSEFRIAAMAAELSIYRFPDGSDLEWRKHVDQTLDSQPLSHGFQERIDELVRELEAANQEDLLRTLHSSLESRRHL